MAKKGHLERNCKGERKEEEAEKTGGEDRVREGGMFGGRGDEEEWQEGNIETIQDTDCNRSLCGLR